MGQMDRTLKSKLEKVESETKELSQSYIEDLNLSPQVDEGICRYLVHRLEGDPAEVVRQAASEGKSGIEQYRILAQLCDPAAAGRNWQDAKSLYHPTQASSMQNLLAHIAEWKQLELRCHSRSGEKVPGTMRLLALLNMCPPKLYDQLMNLPAVANFSISFDELEHMIVSAVHRTWGPRNHGINSVETGHEDESGEMGEEFMLDGELYRLELKNGKRTPINVPQKTSFTSKTFKGRVL